MNEQEVRSTLPIYHQSIDWDALYRRYPPPDVFANTRWTWSADQIRAFQNEQFLDLMKTGWQNEFYRRRWSAAGIEPGDIRSIDDITKLPTFDSDDIKKDQQENPPFGLINGPVRERLRTMPTKVQTSGGTTGKPRPTMYGPVEWEMNGLTMARVLYICGLRPGDIIQIPHTCSLGNAGWCCYKAAHDYLGALPLTTGTGVVTSSRRQIEIARACEEEGLAHCVENIDGYLGTLCNCCGCCCLFIDTKKRLGFNALAPSSRYAAVAGGTMLFIALQQTPPPTPSP